MPPSRLNTWPKPCLARNCATRRLRPPALQNTTIGLSFGNSSSRAGTSPIGMWCASGMAACWTSSCSRTSSIKTAEPSRPSGHRCATSRGVSSGTSGIARTSSKNERFGPLGVDQRRNQRLEETLFGPPASMMHTNEPDFHYGRSADDDEQPAARPQHPYEVLVELGHGARYRDRVELGGVVERHRVRSMDLDVDVGHLGELRARRLDHVRKVLDADDLAGEP